MSERLALADAVDHARRGGTVPVFEALDADGAHHSLVSSEGRALRWRLWADAHAERPELHCVHCGHRVTVRMLRAGRYRRWVAVMGPAPAVLAHLPGATCRTPYRDAGESLAHADLKDRAVAALAAAGVAAAREVIHPNGRRSDVVATTTSGERYGIEVQVSPLAGLDAVERHEGYVEALGRPEAVLWFARAWRPWFKQVPAVGLDADLANVTTGLWQRPGELLAPSAQFEATVGAFATGRITIIDAGDDGAWVPWLRVPFDDRPGRKPSPPRAKRREVSSVSGGCDRPPLWAQPVAGYEQLAMLDEGGHVVPFYVPRGELRAS